MLQSHKTPTISQLFRLTTPVGDHVTFHFRLKECLTRGRPTSILYLMRGAVVASSGRMVVVGQLHAPLITGRLPPTCRLVSVLKTNVGVTAHYAGCSVDSPNGGFLDKISTRAEYGSTSTLYKNWRNPPIAGKRKYKTWFHQQMDTFIKSIGSKLVNWKRMLKEKPKWWR